MRRFFVEHQQIIEEKIIITGEIIHYMTVVLRLSLGEKVVICTGDGMEHIVELVQFHKDFLTGQIISSHQVTQETSIQVTLYQGMPKGDKLDFIIQKCTEIGIHRIVPTDTQRAVVKIEASKAEKKIQRWQKIAQEASQQSKRGLVSKIELPVSWQQCIAQLQQYDLILVMWEDESTHGLKQFLQHRQLPQNIAIIIGPEGGLTEKEVEQLKLQGAVSVSLGKRILRTETAAMVALTMLLYHSGDLG